MALTAEEKEQVLDMLGELEKNEKERVLASTTAFGNWLEIVAYYIYCKILEAINSLWRYLRNIFY